MMIENITGIILCGGKSSRMKTNKAFLKLGNIPIIEIMLQKMKQNFDNLILSSNNTELFAYLNVPIVKDIYLDRGPLAGIHSSLKYSATEKNFIISCDIPLITVELIKYLSEYNSDKKIILPVLKGRIQQLCGVYSKSILADVEQLLKASQGNNEVKGSIFNLLERVDAEIVDVSSFSSPGDDIFLNMNTPEDYELIKKIYSAN
jgi:molybdopterin-guanine dinucleotide biosynthesis protein A